MCISALRLENFRSYAFREFEFSGGINMITGANGAGKTNILEALYVLSITKSFRRASERDMVRFGEKSYGIAADFDGGAAEVRYAGSGVRSRKLNGAEIKTAREWLGNVPSVFFGPQELNIVRESPAVRRDFLNKTLCQLSGRYFTALSKYNRAHAQRNAELNSGFPDGSIVKAYEDVMLEYGASLQSERKAYVGKLGAICSRIHAGIAAGETSELSYAPGAFAHRDELGIMINGRAARTFASQGQIRTAALSLKLAEREIMRETLDDEPILLLDDVLSELDASRREMLSGGAIGGQIFITDCSGGGSIKTGRVIEIEREV